MPLSNAYRKSSASIQAEIQYNKRTKEENRLSAQREIENRNRIISFVSEWQDNGLRVAWKSDLKRTQETAKEELLMANNELLLIRKRAMHNLLSRDLEKYEMELSSRDLSFHRNRI